MVPDGKKRAEDLMSEQARDRKAKVAPGESLQCRLLSPLNGKVASHVYIFFIL